MSTVICKVDDLTKNSGSCALLTQNGQQQQIAIYYLPNTEQKVFGLGNWDPIGQANVMSRGMVGSIDDELVVASPLYKQHFSLTTGKCLEQEASLPVYELAIEDQNVVLKS